MTDPATPDTLTAAAERDLLDCPCGTWAGLEPRPNGHHPNCDGHGNNRLIEERLAAAPAPAVDRQAQWGREAFRLAARAGWSAFGSHVDQSVTLEFDGDGEDGLPIWERPVRPVLDHPEADHAG